MNHLLTQMLGESGSVEIQASCFFVANFAALAQVWLWHISDIGCALRQWLSARRQSDDGTAASLEILHALAITSYRANNKADGPSDLVEKLNELAQVLVQCVRPDGCKYCDWS